MNAKKNTSKGWLVVIAIVPVMVVLAILLVKRMERETPTINMELKSPALGMNQTFTLHVADAKSGLRKVWVGLLKDGQEIELLAKDYPSAGFISGGSVHEETIPIEFDPKAKAIKDGKAVIRLVARDYSWRNWGKGNAQYQEQDVIIDTQPPVVNVLSRNHYFSQGGSGLVIYTLSEECPISGVQVGDEFYPGYGGYFADSKIHLAMIAVDYRQGPGTAIQVTGTDFAGNVGRVGLQYLINARTFKRDKINITDQFLDWKMPEFVNQVDAAPGASNLDIFLKVNGDLRRRNYEALTKVTNTSDAKIYWKGAFQRLPAAANRAGFADHRTYLYKGKKIDEQTHLGTDLASLEQSAVPAANAGKVVFAEVLGIYGRTVIIDHGLGLFSMYSHLSSMAVTPEQMVEKGEIIGHTGRSGLAGGDHLHLSMMVHHTFVNPLEWWDAQWIQNNITAKIDSVK